MKQSVNLFIVVMLLIMMIAVSSVQSSIPKIINYQGFLTDQNGKALTGNDFKIVFSLYNRLEGGDPIWQETHEPVSVTDGMFNVLLGSVDSSLSTGLFSGKIYIGITVGGDAELSPRLELASVPYSLHANKAIALDAPDGDPQDAVLVDNDGNVEIAGRVKDKSGFILPVGTVMAFAGNDTTQIEGWLVCDGGEVSRSTYSDLFEVIGITYGGGDGVSTFNLPDLKGNIPVGFDAAQTEFNSTGKTGGNKIHTLTTAEMPAHNHSLVPNNDVITLNGDASGSLFDFDAGGGDIYTNPQYRTAATQNRGGNGAHNNLQPYIVMNYIIKY